MKLIAETSISPPDGSMKRGSVSFDRVAEDYDKSRRVPEEFFRRIEDALAESFGSSRRVLEVGVGTGRIALPLIRRGYHVVGIDISPKMLHLGVEKGLEDPIMGDALLLPFRDRVFHGAVAVHVFHVVGDWRQAAGEIGRVTEDVLVTFLRKPVSGPTPHSTYRELLGPADGGTSRSHDVLDELAAEVSPSMERTLGDYELRTPADVLLRELEERLFSFQWSVPDDDHRRVMEKLWTEFGERDVRTVFRGTVRVWNAADLREAYSDRVEPRAGETER